MIERNANERILITLRTSRLDNLNIGNLTTLMKRSLILSHTLALITTVGFLTMGTAQAEMREFKSAQGTTFKANLKKVKGTNIFLTTDAGKEMQVGLTAFSKEDQNFILKWMTEDPMAVEYNFVCKIEEVILPGKDARNAYYERISTQQKQYKISVQNGCRNSLDELSVDWCAFMLNRVTLSSSSSSYYSIGSNDASSQGELRVKKGSEFQPKLEASHSFTILTPAFTLDSIVDKYATGRKSKDTLQGVWLRFYRGDTLVSEWKSPECPKTEWPGGAHKSKPKSAEIAKNDVEPSKKNVTSKPATSKDATSTVKESKDDDGDVVKIFQLEDKK
jgi:hypothetical protein